MSCLGAAMWRIQRSMHFLEHDEKSVPLNAMFCMLNGIDARKLTNSKIFFQEKHQKWWFLIDVWRRSLHSFRRNIHDHCSIAISHWIRGEKTSSITFTWSRTEQPKQRSSSNRNSSTTTTTTAIIPSIYSTHNKQSFRGTHFKSNS